MRDDMIGNDGTKTVTDSKVAPAKRQRKLKVDTPKERYPAPKHFIQPWHVVLGDTLARADRTTKATEILRQVKKKYKQLYKGKNMKAWIPQAIEELMHTLKTQTFPSDLYPQPVDIGLVLVKCNASTKDRIVPGTAHLYGYKGDKQAMFGKAHPNKALDFFFRSRDAPELDAELLRYQKHLQVLLESQEKNGVHAGEIPPESTAALMDFQETIRFFQRKLDQANQNDIMAKKLLETLQPINALREQWKLVQSFNKCAALVGSEEEEGDGSAGLSVPPSPIAGIAILDEKVDCTAIQTAAAAAAATTIKTTTATAATSENTMLQQQQQQQQHHHHQKQQSFAISQSPPTRLFEKAATKDKVKLGALHLADQIQMKSPPDSSRVEPLRKQQPSGSDAGHDHDDRIHSRELLFHGAIPAGIPANVACGTPEMQLQIQSRSQNTGNKANSAPALKVDNVTTMELDEDPSLKFEKFFECEELEEDFGILFGNASFPYYGATTQRRRPFGLFRFTILRNIVRVLTPRRRRRQGQSLS